MSTPPQLEDDSSTDSSFQFLEDPLLVQLRPNDFGGIDIEPWGPEELPQLDTLSLSSVDELVDEAIDTAIRHERQAESANTAGAVEGGNTPPPPSPSPPPLPAGAKLFTGGIPWRLVIRAHNGCAIFVHA